MACFFAIAFVAIMNSGETAEQKAKKEAERARANELQESVNALRQRADESQLSQAQTQQFLEIVRQIVVSGNEAEREQLAVQLRQFRFSTTTTTLSSVTPATSTTTTTRPSTTTTTARSPSTTSTTRAPPTTPTTCVQIVVAGVCRPSAQQKGNQHER